MAVKLFGSGTALLHSLRSGSNNKHQLQLQPQSIPSSHGVWARLKRARGLWLPGNITKERQDFFSGIAGLAASLTLSRSIVPNRNSLQVSCALSPFEV